MDAQLKLDDFRPDSPPQFAPAPRQSFAPSDLIQGVEVTSLLPRTDGRGSLLELLTTRDGPIEPIVHVYAVTAKAKSVRAWVYHHRQYDRLAYTQGHFQVVLFDIRPESPTFNKLSIFEFGKDRPSLLRIPPFVVHGVKNLDEEDASFINMPTNIYDPKNPDKSRIPKNDPRVPFRFED